MPPLISYFGGMKNNDENTSGPLSATAAFVIHVVDRTADSFSGRIEHDRSGRAVYFSSLSELHEVVRGVLDEIEPASYTS